MNNPEEILKKIKELYPNNDFKLELYNVDDSKNKDKVKYGFIGYNPFRFGGGLPEIYDENHVDNLFLALNSFIKHNLK
jgi:hypothetical protein